MRSEDKIMGRFALVTADSANCVKFKMNGERDDCTGFMNWLSVWDGILFSFDEMKKDFSILNNFEVVMFSGHPYYLSLITTMALALKGKVVTIFLPEGDVSQYDKYGINSFASEVYEAWNAVDVIASMEEDKIPYYKSLTDSLVKFIHVPLDEKMERGLFRVANADKTEHILIYGDNNANAPLTAIAVSRLLDKPIHVVCIDEVKVDKIKKLWGVKIDYVLGKMAQYPFLRLLGKCWLHIYPTRWIGSSRESIACAVARTPCIGTDRSHTQRRLFPKLSCDPYDIEKMVALGKRLYTDLEFYDEIVNYAWDNVNFYNLENTKKRFIEAYEEAKIKIC